MPRKQPSTPPTCFVPTCAEDFVGQAGKVADVLMRKAKRLCATPDQPLKLLISGSPSIGKTSLVNLIARTLASHPASIEDVNGKEVGLELAREWTRSLAYGSIFGSWSVKVVNELDRCSKDAQDMLLTYLDRMKPGHAFLGTTNLNLSSLAERLQTRFQSVRLHKLVGIFTRINTIGKYAQNQRFNLPNGLIGGVTINHCAGYRRHFGYELTIIFGLDFNSHSSRLHHSGFDRVWFKSLLALQFGSFLENVQSKPRSYMAWIVLLGAQSVTCMNVGSTALCVPSMGTL